MPQPIPHAAVPHHHEETQIHHEVLVSHVLHLCPHALQHAIALLTRLAVDVLHCMRSNTVGCVSTRYRRRDILKTCVLTVCQRRARTLEPRQNLKILRVHVQPESAWASCVICAVELVYDHAGVLEESGLPLEIISR